MEQNQEFVSWYEDRKEPTIKVGILREIGLKGKQTKPDLVKNLGHAYTTIDTTLLRDEIGDSVTRLFWRNGTIRTHVDQPLYSLTQFGIVVLLRSHYKKNDENDRKGISDKPYLSLNEFKIFISKFEKEHSEIDGVEMPLDVYDWIYYVNNPSITKQLMSKFKDNSKLKQLTTSIESIDSKIQQLEDEKAELKHKSHNLLSDLLISSSKEK